MVKRIPKELQVYLRGGEDKRKPVKATPERIKILCTAIELGVNLRDACLQAGINKSTVQTWIKKGKCSRSPTDPYHLLYVAIEKAKAKGKLKMLMHIHQDKSWQSKAWLLERLYPEQFGKREQVTHKGNVTLRLDPGYLPKPERGPGAGMLPEHNPQDPKPIDAEFEDMAEDQDIAPPDSEDQD